MGFSRWEIYTGWLRDKYRRYPDANRADFFRDCGTFKDFAEELPKDQRIPLLIHAYERYREVASSDDRDPGVYFWKGSYSILIDRLVAARRKATDAEACRLLAVAYPRAAEWRHLVEPIEMTERIFRNRPYPTDFFDSARAYREPLERVNPRQRRTRRKRSICSSGTMCVNPREAVGRVIQVCQRPAMLRKRHRLLAYRCRKDLHLAESTSILG